MKRGPLKRLGKCATSWHRARARIVPRLVAQGIRGCEFRFEGCWGDASGGLAHAVKRRFISRTAEAGAPEHLETVAVACIPCHRRLDEQMSHELMREAVMAVIARRVE